MEFALALLFAVATLVAVWAITARRIEQERFRRLSDEVGALRIAARGAPAPSVDATHPSLADVSYGPADVETDPGVSRPGTLPAATQLAVDRLLEEVASALDVLRVVEERPAVAEAVAAAREAARDALGAATRTEETLAALVGEATELGKRLALGEPSAWPPLPVVLGATLAVARAGDQGEQLAEESQRIRGALTTVAHQTSRLGTAMRSLSRAAGAVQRSSEEVLPSSATLTGLADRMDLLALNLVQAAPAESHELRLLFEEMRQLSRDLGSLSRRLAESAASVRDESAAALELSETAQGGASRVLDRLDRLDAGSSALLSALSEARRAASDTEEAHRALAHRISLAAELETVVKDALTARAGEVAELVRGISRALAAARDVRPPASLVLEAVESLRRGVADRRVRPGDASGAGVPELDYAALRTRLEAVERELRAQ